jgi:hypothetical protein
MKLLTRHLALFLLLYLSEFTHADSLFISQIKQARWDAEAFDKTLEKLKEHKPIEIADPLKISPFHFRKALQAKTKREFCVTCHTTLPHRESERLRSYLNMHVNYIACTSCHFNPENVNLVYRWYQWDLNSDNAQEVDSKLIIPFYQQKAEAFSQDHPEISTLLAEWEGSALEKKAELHLKIHSPVETEGLNCSACHTEENKILDYADLGFSEEEIKQITENRISRFLSDDKFEDKPIKLMDLLQ